MWWLTVQRHPGEFNKIYNAVTFRQPLKSFMNSFGNHSGQTKSPLILWLSGTTSILHLCKSIIAVPCSWCPRLNQSRFAVIYKPEWHRVWARASYANSASCGCLGCACRECVYITLIWAFFPLHTAGPRESWKPAVRIIFYLLTS